MNPTDTDKRLAAIHKRLHDYRESTSLPRSEFLENAPADTAYLLDLVSRLTSPTPLSSHAAVQSVPPDSAPGAGDVGDLAAQVVAALHTLRLRGLLATSFLAGMVFKNSAGHWIVTITRGNEPPTGAVSLVLSDPATIGCLLALLREVSGERDVYVIPASGWTVCTRNHGDFHGVTEGQAIAAAFIALAGGR